MEHGASAPIVRPIRVADFTKTVRALLRSRPASDESSRGILDLGGEILIDLPARKVTVRGRAVHLTPNEFKLLAVLVEHAGAIVPYDRLLTAVWGPAHTQQVQSLRVHMTQLRHKLEQKPSRPNYLSTEIGLGYGLRAR
jgi:two-component system KDP operon response regulator KdpE